MYTIKNNRMLSKFQSSEVQYPDMVADFNQTESNHWCEVIINTVYFTSE